MPQAVTAEEAAQQVLSVFVKTHRIVVGDSLTGLTIAMAFEDQGLNRLDMEPGMQYAIDEGWLELTPRHSLLLTQKGFDAAK
jgi:hypothetical protein